MSKYLKTFFILFIGLFFHDLMLWFPPTCFALAPSGTLVDRKIQYTLAVDIENRLWHDKDYPEFRLFLLRNIKRVLKSPDLLKPYFSSETHLAYMYGHPLGTLPMAVWFHQMTETQAIEILIKSKKVEDIALAQARKIYEAMKLLGLQHKFHKLVLTYEPDNYETFSNSADLYRAPRGWEHVLEVNIARIVTDDNRLSPQVIRVAMIHELGHVVFCAPNPEHLANPESAATLLMQSGGISTHPTIRGLRFDFTKYDPVYFDHCAAVCEIIANWFLYTLSPKLELEFGIDEVTRQALDNFEYLKKNLPDAEISTWHLAQLIAIAEYAGIEKGKNLLKAEKLLDNSTRKFVDDLKNFLSSLEFVEAHKMSDALLRFHSDDFAHPFLESFA